MRKQEKKQMTPNRRIFLGQVPLTRHPALRGAAVAVTDETFGQALSAPRAIVDFWSPECQYCVQFKPVFEAVAAASNGDIAFIKANVDEGNMKSAGDFKIAGLPGIIFLKDGKEVGRVEGAMSEGDFLSKIAQVYGAGVGGPGIAPGSTLSSGITVGKVVGGVALLGVLGGVIWGLTRIVKF